MCLHVIDSFTTMLISRFMMNLRAVYTPGGSAAGSLHLSGFSDIRFANSVVGNLVAPLGFEEEEERSLGNRPDDEDIQVANISSNPLMEYLPSESVLDDTPSGAPKEEGGDRE